MAQRFLAETQLPLTYSAENTRATIWAAIHSPLIFLVWQGEETLGGMVMGDYEHDFTEETAAYVMKFYVERELRGMNVARELLQAFDAEVKQRGASVVFASSTAGMGPTNETLYVRLFEHEGYNVLGRVLVKEFR